VANKKESSANGRLGHEEKNKKFPDQPGFVVCASPRCPPPKRGATHPPFQWAVGLVGCRPSWASRRGKAGGRSCGKPGSSGVPSKAERRGQGSGLGAEFVQTHSGSSANRNIQVNGKTNRSEVRAVVVIVGRKAGRWVGVVRTASYSRGCSAEDGGGR